MPAHGSLLSSHLFLKISIPLSIYCFPFLPFHGTAFSLWLLLCFLVPSSFLCSVLGAAVPCCEQPASYQGDLLCVCVCRVPLWVSLVQKWNPHLVSVLLPDPPDWRAPFLLQVSHCVWWVISLAGTVTAVILVPLAEFQHFAHNHNFQSGWIKDWK